jgi:50S ribosomal subunit-associated GTPase HflX
MKMIYSTFNVALLEEVKQWLKEINFDNYQIIEEMNSKTIIGDPRMNDAVWPGYNSGVFIQTMREDRIEKFSQKVIEHNKNRHNDQEFIMVFEWTIDKCIIP